MHDTRYKASTLKATCSAQETSPTKGFSRKMAKGFFERILTPTSTFLLGTKYVPLFSEAGVSQEDFFEILLLQFSVHLKGNT